jgi:hypothetical protein
MVAHSLVANRLDNHTVDARGVSYPSPYKKYQRILDTFITTLPQHLEGLKSGLRLWQTQTSLLPFLLDITFVER